MKTLNFYQTNPLTQQLYKNRLKILEALLIKRSKRNLNSTFFEYSQDELAMFVK